LAVIGKAEKWLSGDLSQDIPGSIERHPAAGALPNLAAAYCRRE